jgi:hypothetical protein
MVHAFDRGPDVPQGLKGPGRCVRFGGEGIHALGGRPGVVDDGSGLWIHDASVREPEGKPSSRRLARQRGCRHPIYLAECVPQPELPARRRRYSCSRRIARKGMGVTWRWIATLFPSDQTTVPATVS